MKALTLALAALTATSVFAAPTAKTTEKIISVPFEFQVRDITLPAGHYSVQQDAFRDEAILVNQETGKKAVIIRATQRGGANTAKLVFERKGEGFKLVQAW